MQPPGYFERVRASAAKRWDQLDADPELAGPWHQLFKQVQSPRHVVSELLQNADDAGATEARIRIEGDAFVFEHNGRDFRDEEFASLCRFGYSNKRSLHTIGHRGIGFKSTFSIGERVELQTPTLSVYFTKARFTLPTWIDASSEASGRTRISVQFADERRMRELRANIDEWAKNAVSLLFFRNIRALEIDGRWIRWESLGSGEPDNAEWFCRSDDANERVLLIRSSEEPFPSEALAEIRQERMVMEDEHLDYPPSSVEIVLGAKGDLFVVLPTRVATLCPFASNAPFIQDPAREGIKDPTISPTNRWLLQRIGNLAASSMLKWIRSNAEDRSEAYDLLPAAIANQSLRPFDQSVANSVREAFDGVLEGESYVLGFDDKLHVAGSVIRMPKAIHDTWPERDPAAIFDDGKPSLGLRVSGENAVKLVVRGAVEEISLQDIVGVLRLKSIPKPRGWTELLSLWTFLTQDAMRMHYSFYDKHLQIVPVQGQDLLFKAPDVIRLGEAKLLEADDDWTFLTPYLLCVDQGWAKYLNDLRRRYEAEEEPRKKSVGPLGRIFELLRTLGLADGADATRVMERVCASFFDRRSINNDDTIRLAHIAAKLNANVARSMHYVTAGMETKPTSETLLADRDGAVSALLPGEWREQHVISHSYWTATKSCSREAFTEWALSERSGLLPFILPEEVKISVYNRSEIRDQIHKRGGIPPQTFRYKSNWFQIEDWDFPEGLWEFWASMEIDDLDIYANVMDRLLKVDLRRVRERSESRVVQFSQGGAYENRVNEEALFPSWVLRIRERRCLRDTNGIARKPAELLRRTAATEPFLGIEPFVERSIDVEAASRILDMLGVQTEPGNPYKLLDRVRALSGLDDPPVAELENLYRRLDGLCAACSTEELGRLRERFESEALILSDDGEWKTARDVFVESNEEDVPGAAVIARSVRHFAMWSKIGVSQRPTLGLAIDWLRHLPTRGPLEPGVRKRVRAVIARHADEVWSACRQWLSLDGDWTPVEDLRWCLTMQSLVPHSHLFASTKSKVADFQMLSAQQLSSEAFRSMPTLASSIREEISGDTTVGIAMSNEPWLHEFGALLAYAQFDDAATTERISALANRLARTTVVFMGVLEVIPYIDGVPVGAKRRVNALWSDDRLYVGSKSGARLAAELTAEVGRVFDRNDVSDALKICFERDSEFIEEYLEQNFILVDELPELALRGQESKIDDRIKEGAVPALAGAIAAAPDACDLPDAQRDSEIPNRSDDSGRPAVSRRVRRKVDLFERFAVGAGFSKISSHRFKSPDAWSYDKDPDGIFPWKLRSPSGTIECEYWILDRSLEQGAIDVPSEVWEMMQRRPEHTGMILADVTGAPLLLKGRDVVSQHYAGDLLLYPASYRLQKRS